MARGTRAHAAVAAETRFDERSLGHGVLDAHAREHAIRAAGRAPESMQKKRRRETATSKTSGQGNGNFGSTRAPVVIEPHLTDGKGALAGADDERDEKARASLGIAESRAEPRAVIGEPELAGVERARARGGVVAQPKEKAGVVERRRAQSEPRRLFPFPSRTSRAQSRTMLQRAAQRGHSTSSR